MEGEENKKIGKTKYVTVHEYCNELNPVITEMNKEMINKEIEKRNKENERRKTEGEKQLKESDKIFPWIDSLSDHLPLFLHHTETDPITTNNNNNQQQQNEMESDYEGFKFITWNVNNKKYGKWLQKTEKNDEQRLWWIKEIVSTVESDQLLREKIIVEKVIDLIKKHDVIALQEVSSSLNELLTNHTSLIGLIQSRISHSSTRKIDNCNLIVYNVNKVKLIEQNILFPAEYNFNSDKTNSEKPKIVFTATYVGLFENRQTRQRFYFASVHMNYNSPFDYARKIHELERKYPMFIAGDFNKGIRYPITPPGKHMEVYSRDCFRFPSLSHCYSFSANSKSIYNFLPYSHVCKFGNVGSEDKMLDRYDHIIYVTPNK